MNDIDLSAAHVTSRHLAEFDRAGGYRFFHRSGEEAKDGRPGGAEPSDRTLAEPRYRKFGYLRDSFE
ncbi:MAG: hypothetical protein WCK73_03760 [Deltaproteobacteria bacterium]